MRQRHRQQACTQTAWRDRRQVFVWIGKGTSKEERCAGMTKGTEYVQQAGRPAHTRVTKVIEGGAYRQGLSPPQLVNAVALLC